MRLIAAVLLCVATTASAAIPTSQRDALIAIYNSTGGPSWINRENWLGAAGTECSWAGVQCDEAQAHVAGIFLYDNNLTGTIPAAIGNFPQLKDLYLYGNPALTGPIPTTIGQLTNLERLFLDRTNINGTIPTSIGNLTKLKILAINGTAIEGNIPREIGNLRALEELLLTYNLLAGSIPPEIGQLTELTALDLDVNQLSGTIPKELANLQKLQRFNATQNQLSGNIPPELGNLSSLVTLNLTYNVLTGSVPPQLAGLRNLDELDLGNNILTGTIPKELGDMPALRVLSLVDNDIEGTIPTELLRAAQLEELYLGGNELTGEIPRGINQLTNLQVLSLYDNGFTGTIPAEITQLSKLRSFEVQFNDLTGTIPADLGNLTALAWFDAAGNALTGPIPTSVGRLTELTIFSVYENDLDGPIPPELGQLTKLDRLFLADNRLTGAIPDSLRNLRLLQQLTASGNQLTGSVPSWIGELTDLQVLFLGYNQLGGTIPASLAQLTKLSFLDLSNNHIGGSLPPDIGNLRNLGYLTLGFNQIGGPIPASFGQLESLEYASLEFNEFSGPLPREIGNLSKLQSLQLSANDLEGPLPPELGNLANLEYLYLFGNRFSGTIPKELANLKKLQQIDLSSNAFRGPFPPEIMGLTSLTPENSNFYYNGLFTNDAAVKAFVESKQYGEDSFLITQTITPPNPRIVATTDRSATLEWETIPYHWDGGGYQVTASTTPGGAPVVIATTDSKEVSSIVVRGLDASTTYHFTIAAVTHPNAYQKNLVVSEVTSVGSGTTGPRVIAPADIALTEPTSGLVQIDGTPRTDDSFTLTNFGDRPSNITFEREGDFFTFTPETFTLAGGASQVVRIQSVPKPIGTYYGYLYARGDGTGDGIYIPLVLLSAARPVGTVIAEAVASRIEITGVPGSDSVGIAQFRNSGTAPLSGVVISDQPWVQPDPNPITIAPGETASVSFRIIRARRPQAEGALSANLSLVYVDGTAASLAGGLQTTTPGVGVSVVTVVDTTRPPVTSSGLPGSVAGEVPLFIPGMVAVQRAFGSFASDISILNGHGARSLSDLRLYFTRAGTSTTSVASIASVPSSQSVSLVNVVNNVYGNNDTVGTLQVRSADWENLGIVAKLTTLRNSGTMTGDVPVFRADRSAPSGQSIYLAGVRKPSDLFVQETGGTATSVRIDFLDANGSSVGNGRTESLAAFALLDLRDAVPAGAVTAIVTNNSGGQLAAYARVIDESSGDTWSVADWSRVNRFALNEATRVPLVEPAGSVPPPRRRRSVNFGTGDDRARTDITLFNPLPGDARVRVTVIEESGRTSERELTVGSRRTVAVNDVGSAAFASTANAVVEPLRGSIVVSARTHRSGSGGAIGTGVPIVPAPSGLRVGQSQIFANLDDSTSTTVAARRPNTFRTSYGFVETAGRPVTVRVRIAVSDSRSIASAILSRDFRLEPRQQVFVPELVRSVIGESRDTAFGELKNLQLRVEVVEGNGAVIPFVLVTDNGSGDTHLRLE